ncbi:unnamed protein product [Polarella glacialis]|uniref:Uncharacterized protein n=1 Tax=Polarella glacialis TaxID=89957 RepID=A0A813F789_POLGL|nr:unnamed protein product [Polarella glacialis]
MVIKGPPAHCSLFARYCALRETYSWSHTVQADTPSPSCCYLSLLLLLLWLLLVFLLLFLLLSGAVTPSQDQQTDKVLIFPSVTLHLRSIYILLLSRTKVEPACRFSNPC